LTRETERENAIFGEAGSQRRFSDHALCILFKCVCVCVYDMTQLEFSNVF